MPPLPKSQVLKNLKDLQTRLDTNTRVRNAFLADPAGALSREGLVLPPERTKSLKSFIDKQVGLPNSRVVGATIRPGANPAAIEVEISVSVKF
jgi:hypothetical protein